MQAYTRQVKAKPTHILSRFPGNNEAIKTSLSHEIISQIEKLLPANGLSDFLLVDVRVDNKNPQVLNIEQDALDNQSIKLTVCISCNSLIATEAQANSNQQDDAIKPRLTNREKDVLQFIVKGLSYSEIAQVLVMSVHTVTSHIKNIYRKLSVHSRGEAAFEAMQLGLIE